jgi:hypothetical protein
MPDETLPVAMTTTPGMASADPNAASRHFHVSPTAMGHLLGIGPVGKSPAGCLIVGTIIVGVGAALGESRP